MKERYLLHTYKRDLCIVRGKGSYLYDASGKMYLDMTGGIATCSMGHAHPEIARAIMSQAGLLINCSNLFLSEPQTFLAKKLAELSGLEKVFFSNSGTEANEAAIKLARRVSGKKKIISMTGGFHGRTLGSLSATWKKKIKQPFEPLVPGFTHAELNAVRAKSAYFFNKLAGLKSANIRDVRGKGLMIGIELVQPAESYQYECRKKGLLVSIVAKNVIRLLPPLNVSLGEIDSCVSILGGVLSC